MDTKQFDRALRLFATSPSRRQVLGGVLGVLVGGVLGSTAPISAKGKKRKGGKAKGKKKPAATCVPDALAATCAGRCGFWTNNCGQTVACLACPAGKTCSSNGSCVQVCTADAQCPDACSGCGFPSTDGTRACLQPVMACPTQTCSSTAECPPGTQCQKCFKGGPNICAPLCRA